MYEFSDDADDHKKFTAEQWTEFYSKLPETGNADFAEMKKINPKIDENSLIEFFKEIGDKRLNPKIILTTYKFKSIHKDEKPKLSFKEFSFFFMELLVVKHKIKCEKCMTETRS